jgi:hypothetical protein
MPTSIVLTVVAVAVLLVVGYLIRKLFFLALAVAAVLVALHVLGYEPLPVLAAYLSALVH